jgi:hypothetical protein
VLRLITLCALLHTARVVLAWAARALPDDDVLDPDAPINLWPVDHNDTLQDWLVRHYAGVPDDARELKP